MGPSSAPPGRGNGWRLQPTARAPGSARSDDGEQLALVHPVGEPMLAVARQEPGFQVVGLGLGPIPVFVFQLGVIGFSARSRGVDHVDLQVAEPIPRALVTRRGTRAVTAIATPGRPQGPRKPFCGVRGDEWLRPSTFTATGRSGSGRRMYQSHSRKCRPTSRRRR